MKLPPGVLYEHPTVADLAAVIRTERRCDEQSVRDWTQALADIRLEDEITAVGRTLGQPAPPERILLTGATGFFGSHALEEILRSTRTRVDCLVRAESAESARTRLIQTLANFGIPVDESFGRVRAIPGDLDRVQFGLSNAEYARLAEEVDSIIHSGALVDFVRGYQAVRRTNVDGTREVLRFATTARVKAVHHVSSVAVFEADPFRGGARGNRRRGSIRK